MTRLFICTAVALFMGTIPALAADYSNPSTSQTGQDVSPSTKSAKTPPSGSADTSSGAAQQSSAPPSSSAATPSKSNPTTGSGY
jgi:hypothetical protein